MRWTRASLGAAAVAALTGVAAHDLLQRRHAILRNFPVIGHARYLIERLGPELRQYVVAGNDEERPFSRDQRRWVYASAKLENNNFGFGTDNDIEHTPGYVIIKHRTFGPAAPPTAHHVGEQAWLPCAKVLGAARGRRHAFRPDSVVNISGMSFGALSGNAVTALNRGCRAGGLPAEHRRGRHLALPSQRRRAGLPDRQRLLRLPGPARPVRPRPLHGHGRLRTGARAGDQAQPGRQARSRRRAAPRQGVGGDRRDARGVPRGE